MEGVLWDTKGASLGAVNDGCAEVLLVRTSTLVYSTFRAMLGN
jgi:hypothetical protein